MTGSQVKGRSFRGALRYNQEKVATGKAEVLDNSFANTTERNIMKEVAMVRMQRPDLKNYFYHTSINFPKEENVSEKVLRELEKKYNLTQVVSSKQAQERGMTKNEMEMVQRSNVLSHKMAMQVIIKDVLESKKQMTTDEFISSLSA
jgi:hypothetical protein